jgi:hypothetical protein
MLFPRRIKRVIAGAAGLIFFLCYSAGFAKGCASTTGAPEKSEMPPCHQMMGDESTTPSKSTSSPSRHSLSNCHDVASLEVDHSIPDWSKVFVVAVADNVPTPVSEAPPFQPPSLRVKPPPLRILHCCLRN